MKATTAKKRKCIQCNRAAVYLCVPPGNGTVQAYCGHHRSRHKCSEGGRWINITEELRP